MVVLTPVEGPREAWLPLLLEADESEPIVRAYLDEGELLEILEDGASVGVVLLTSDGDDVEIKNLAISKEHRGRGIGRAAIAAVADHARAGGVQRLIVGTADSGPTTIRFYLHAGFERAGVRTGFFDAYPEPVVEDGVRAHDMIMFAMDLSRPGEA